MKVFLFETHLLELLTGNLKNLLVFQIPTMLYQRERHIFDHGHVVKKMDDIVFRGWKRPSDDIPTIEELCGVSRNSG